ncbi:unnamed protein product [Ixodes hexagonus]
MGIEHRRRASKHGNTEIKTRRKVSKADPEMDVDESLSFRTTTKKPKKKGRPAPTSPEDTTRGPARKKRQGKSSKTASRTVSPKPVRGAQTKNTGINEAYYEVVGGDLATACQVLSDHERDIIWKAVDVIAAIPTDYPPRRYITRLCCCDTCCMRCCTNADHKETGFHTAVKADVATDVPDEVELTASGSDMSVLLAKSDQASCDLAEFSDESKPVAARAVAAAREAKRAIEAAKQFRTASQTVQSLECSTDNEQRMRRQYAKDLMEKAVAQAKMARDALAKYRVLKKAARKNPEMTAQIMRNDEVASLESLLSQDAVSSTRRARISDFGPETRDQSGTVNPEEYQARTIGRYASAPYLVTRSSAPSPYGGYFYDTQQQAYPPPPGSYPHGPPLYGLTPSGLHPPGLRPPGLHPYGAPPYGVPPDAGPGARYRGPPYGRQYGPPSGPPLSDQQPACFPDPDYGGFSPRWASAPEVLTGRDRSSVDSAAALARRADVAINKARQVAEEANKLQRISAAMLAEARTLESSAHLKHRSARKPSYDRPVKNVFYSDAYIPSDDIRYRDDRRSSCTSGQDGSYDAQFTTVEGRMHGGIEQDSVAYVPGRTGGATRESRDELYDSQERSYDIRTAGGPPGHQRVRLPYAESDPRITRQDRALSGTQQKFKSLATRRASVAAGSHLRLAKKPSDETVDEFSKESLAPSRTTFNVASTVQQPVGAPSATSFVEQNVYPEVHHKPQEKLAGKGTQQKFKSVATRRQSVAAGSHLRLAKRPSDETVNESSKELPTAKIAAKRRQSVVSTTTHREKPVPRPSSARRASVAPQKLLGEDAYNKSDRQRLSITPHDVPWTISTCPLAPESSSNLAKPTRRASVSQSKRPLPDDNVSDRSSKGAHGFKQTMDDQFAMGRQVVKITLPPIAMASKKVGTRHFPARDEVTRRLAPGHSTFCGSCARDDKQIQEDIDEGVGSEPRSTKRTAIIEDLSEQSLDIEIVPSQKSKSTQMSSPKGRRSPSYKNVRSEEQPSTSQRETSSSVKTQPKANQPEAETSQKYDDGLSMKSFEDTLQPDQAFKGPQKKPDSIINEPLKETTDVGDSADSKVAMTAPGSEDQNLVSGKDMPLSLAGQSGQDDKSAPVKPAENSSDKVKLDRKDEERFDQPLTGTARSLSNIKAAGSSLVSSEASAKHEKKKPTAVRRNSVKQKKGKSKASMLTIYEGQAGSNTSTLSKTSTKSIQEEISQANAAPDQLDTPEKPKVLPSETYVLSVSTIGATSAGGDAKTHRWAPNNGHLDTAEPPNEASKDEKGIHDEPLEKTAQLNSSFIEGRGRKDFPLDANVRDNIQTSARHEEPNATPENILPEGFQGEFHGEPARQEAAEAPEGVANDAHEVASRELSHLTPPVDLDEEPELAAVGKIKLIQEPPRHEVVDIQDIKIRPLPMLAPLRGPAGQNIRFWDLDRAGGLFPESQLVLALSFVGAVWVLFIMFTTTVDPNVRPIFKVAPKPMAISPRPRFLVDTNTSDEWATRMLTNATVDTAEDMTVDTTVDMTIAEASTSPTNARSFYACDTPYCEREASYLRSLLVGNPCINFYSYACRMQTSLWKPNLGSSVSVDTLMEDQIEKVVTSYILDKSHREMGVASDLLRACADLGDTDSWHRMEMNDLFFEYFGSTWPVDDKPVTAEAVWVMAGRLVRDLKLEAFAAVSIDVHPENKAAYVIGIDEPNLLYRDGDWSRAGYTELLTGAIEESVVFMNADANVRLHISNIKQTMVLLAKLVASPAVRHMGAENYRLSNVRLLVPAVKAFLSSVFLDTADVTDSTNIMVKSPLYFERLERAGSPEFSSTNLLNYLGFRVMVHFGTFLQQRLLRELRTIEAGFSYQGDIELERLCAREVERTLPAFYLRAYSLRMANISLLVKSWASKLERMFIQGLPRIAWMRERRHRTAPSDSDVRVAKYKILNHNIETSIPSWVLRNASFLEYHRGLLRHVEVSSSLDPSNILKRFRLFVRLLQQERLRGLRAAKNMTTNSVFDTQPSYDVQRKNVHIPMTILNASVPANSTSFIVHSARYGVRIFKALIPALYQDYVYDSNQHDQGPLLYTDGYQEHLRDTIQCLISQYRALTGQLKSTVLKGIQDLSSAGLAILEQTLALQQAYWTFQELLNIKRVWRSDFRLAGLLQLSSEQLFFVAYALDNCEASDDVFRRHSFQTTFRLPPEDRVNFPLSQLEAFAQAFSCHRNSPMIGRKRCPVFLDVEQPNL